MRGLHYVHTRVTKKVALFTVGEIANNACFPHAFFALLTTHLPLLILKMSKISTLSSFEPTEPQKHDHTPQKAAVLGTFAYLYDHHICI